METASMRVSETEKKEFYKNLGGHGLIPFWEIRSELIPGHPTTLTKPHIWRIEAVRQLIDYSGDSVDVKGAERRGLVLENPGLAGRYACTQSLYAGYQLVMPGEVAYNHAHTPGAFRFVLEGEGAHSVVAGEKFYMTPGDVLITPNMAWHDHGNESKNKVLWIDGLDIPMVQHYGATFKRATPHPPEGPVNRPVGDGVQRLGAGVVPANFQYAASPLASPRFHYPYEGVRASLEAMRKAGDIDECHGFKVQYTNPMNGDHAFPTMGLFLQLVPKNFAAVPYRSSADTVFIVHEGKGKTIIGDQTIEWGQKDVFVVPCWYPHQHIPAGGDAILFSFSDCAAQQKLGLWFEQRGKEPMSFDRAVQ